MQDTLDVLSKLTDLRKKADGVQIDGLTCAAKYTEIIQSLLELTNSYENPIKVYKVS